jgi:chromosome segregation ATPase
MTEEDKKVDYLEVDDLVPGQNFVCLSFVSPDSIIESKEAFKVSKFLQSYCKDQDLNLDDVMKKYTDYTYKYQNELQKDFDERNKFQTNIRGLKVRGTYSTREEAEKRAKSLQTIDSDFHVFVGQVGYWLPWDPCADKIEDEHYMNDQLNEMMEKYKENNISRDIFYEEEKRNKLKTAKEEQLKKKKEEMERQKKELEDPGPEGTPSKVDEILEKVEEDVKEVVDDSKKTVEDVEEVVEDVKEVVEDVKEVVEDVKDVKDVVEGGVKEVVDNILKGGNVDEDMKNSLESVDPWMANKMKQQ